MSSPTCLILGGTGTLAATAEDLARSGADVAVTCRRPELAPAHWSAWGIRVVRADRDDADAVAALVGDGVDGLVDGQCYTASHGKHLAALSHRCGSTVMLSARAVYTDSRGRHANSEDAPHWPGPTAEDTPTMAYHGERFDSRLGYGANKAEAERILGARGARVSILRPARIHGPSTRRIREWPLVRAVLAGSPMIAVERAQATGTLTSTASIAWAAAACLSRPAARVVNVGDAPAVSNLRAARILVGALARAAGTEVVAAPEEGPTARSAAADAAPHTPPGGARIPGAWATGQELDLSALQALIGTPPSTERTLAETARWVHSLARRASDGTWELPEAFDGS
jgi:NAD(P)-dependent dehydrogenase (short-subunit alcohol dehydrogenase family)